MTLLSTARPTIDRCEPLAEVRPGGRVRTVDVVHGDDRLPHRRLEPLDEPLAESVGSDAASGNRLVEDGVEQVVVESELARRSVTVEVNELDGVGGAGGTSGRADSLVASAELVVQMSEQRAHERRLAIVAQ